VGFRAFEQADEGAEVERGVGRDVGGVVSAKMVG